MIQYHTNGDDEQVFGLAFSPEQWHTLMRFAGVDTDHSNRVMQLARLLEETAHAAVDEASET